MVQLCDLVLKEQVVVLDGAGEEADPSSSRRTGGHLGMCVEVCTHCTATRHPHHGSVYSGGLSQGASRWGGDQGCVKEACPRLFVLAAAARKGGKVWIYPLRVHSGWLWLWLCGAMRSVCADHFTPLRMLLAKANAC